MSYKQDIEESISNRVNQYIMKRQEEDYPEIGEKRRRINKIYKDAGLEISFLDKVSDIRNEINDFENIAAYCLGWKDCLAHLEYLETHKTEGMPNVY